LAFSPTLNFLPVCIAKLLSLPPKYTTKFLYIEYLSPWNQALQGSTLGDLAWQPHIAPSSALFFSIYQFQLPSEQHFNNSHGPTRQEEMSPALALTTICAALIGLLNPVLAYPHGTTYHVTQGQSIQAIINKAHGGDKIVVEAGTYAEQLTISTDGLTLEGHDAKIVPPPPASTVKNSCTGLAGPENPDAGICIQGSGIVFSTAPFDTEHVKVSSVAKRVKDTSIKGFTVTGFNGLDIAVLGAQDAHVSENTVSSGERYGILTVGSTNSKINHNTVIYEPGYFDSLFIGICMDDMSTVTIAHNDISGYAIGLCVQTAGARIHDNNVHGTCVGAYVDPGIKGAKLHNNTFSNSVPACAGFSAGIIIAGGINTVVKDNTFSGIENAGALQLMDDDASGTVASGNLIEKNTFTDNDLDISDTATGKGNVIKKNACVSSVPTTLCS
jgi:parallel beta-helix repeat protein